VCVYNMHIAHVYIVQGTIVQIYIILGSTAWLKAKLSPREYRKKTRVIEYDLNQYNDLGILISRIMTGYYIFRCNMQAYRVRTNNTHGVLCDCYNIILLKFTGHKVNVRDQSAGILY